jgi:hypothetical protein
MSTNNRLAAIAIGFAVVATPLFGAAAGTAPYRRHFANRPLYRPVQVATVDGWRHRTGRGWDHSCHNLDYLPNMFACSAK